MVDGFDGSNVEPSKFGFVPKGDRHNVSPLRMINAASLFVCHAMQRMPDSAYTYS